MRSVLAVLALMTASAVGGFLYSELLKQRDSEDLRAMRLELRELKDLATAARAAPPIEPKAEVLAAVPMSEATRVNLTAAPMRAESVAYVPACRRIAAEGQTTAGCSEAEAQRIALCGSIPAYAHIEAIDLFAQPDAVQRPWDEHRAALEQDLGGARFTGKSFEYSQSSELKAVCVNFAQWSSDHSHIARIVVNYSLDGSEQPNTTSDDQLPALPAVVAAEGLPDLSQQATLVTNTQP